MIFVALLISCVSPLLKSLDISPCRFTSSLTLPLTLLLSVALTSFILSQENPPLSSSYVFESSEFLNLYLRNERSPGERKPYFSSVTEHNENHCLQHPKPWPSHPKVSQNRQEHLPHSLSATFSLGSNLWGWYGHRDCIWNHEVACLRSGFYLDDPWELFLFLFL